MKKLLLKIKGFFIVLFGKEEVFEEFLKQHVDDAISIVETFKFLVENNVVITLLNAFPGKFGERAKPILERIQLYLGEVLAGLDIGKGCLALPSLVDRITCVVNAIKQKPIVEREDIYQSIAVGYTIKMSANYTVDKQPIPRSVAKTMVEMKHLELSAEQKNIEPAKEEPVKAAKSKKPAKKTSKKSGK